MMTPQASLFAGLVAGLSIAAPVGPMGMLCIQRTLVSGMRVGVSTGLGAATVNVLYGGLILFGLGRMAPLMASGGRVLGIAGGLFLLWSALRTVMRQHSAESPPVPTPLSPLAAYVSAVAFNATNPMSPVLILALLTPIVGLASPPWPQAATLLAGMFAAATCWWICLSLVVSLLRSRMGPRVLGLVNQVAAAVLTFYGALALARSAGM